MHRKTMLEEFKQRMLIVVARMRTRKVMDLTSLTHLNKYFFFVDD